VTLTVQSLNPSLLTEEHPDQLTKTALTRFGLGTMADASTTAEGRSTTVEASAASATQPAAAPVWQAMAGVVAPDCTSTWPTALMGVTVGDPDICA